MKTPPFLLGAALLFWGWQTGFFAISAAMAVALESARWVKANWEFSDEDFSRIWTFCSVLFLGMVVYTLTASDVAGELSGLARNPYFLYQRNAGAASARAAATLVRWIPMVFFPFAAAQLFSSREEIPLTTMSLILRRRRQQDRKLGRPLPPVRSLNLSYPYFAACLSAASIHTGADIAFFGGLSVLMAWALWPQRSRRFGVFVWAGALLTAIALGYFSQRGVGQLQGYLDRLNPVWLLRFSRRGFDPMQNRTMLGQIGRVKLSGKIVIRLEPKAGSRAPALLRENSYRFYGTQVSPVWYTGGSEEDFVPVQSETNETTWMLLPEKTNTATVNIACYLAGGRALLPLPTGSGRLDLNLPAFALQKNRTGAVFAQGLRFITFDAHYGPGASIDAAASTDADSRFPGADTGVVMKETPTVLQVLAEMHLTKPDTEQDLRQTLRTISEFFQNNFTYSTWQGPPASTSTNETALGRFLLSTRRGHCEYFATATVLLLRKLDVPARYAVGYAVHESSGGRYVVRERDAHAWCLVWNRFSGTWEDFDTTPASWVEEETNRASHWQFLSDLWSWIGFEFSKFWWGQTGLRQYLLLALAPVLAVLLYQIIFRKRGRRRQRKQTEAEAAVARLGLDSEFYQLEKKLAERGASRRPGEPLSEWLFRAAADPALTEMEGALRKLLGLHYRYRFDPCGLNKSDREELKRGATACLTELAETKRPATRGA